ncbi:MAG: TonB family protein [Proteobacteria bacterium]|nr:TonB family protein [Pseudomonadota bacterium]
MISPGAGDSLLASVAYRRLLAWSCAAHLAGGVALVFSDQFRFRSSLPDPVYVSVVAAEPRPEAAAPAAPPPRQEVDEIVIPRRPRPKPASQAKPRPKPRPRAELAPRPEPKPKPRAEPASRPEPKPKTQSRPALDDLMARLQKTTSERPSGVKPGADRDGRRGVFNRQLAAYRKRVESIVARNWDDTSACMARSKFPVWEVRLAASGRVTGVRLARASGDRYCDDSAERAIMKAQPLPPPPGKVRVLDVNFGDRG